MADKRQEAKGPVEATKVTEISNEDLERIRLERFQERVNRVVAVMKRERVDWRGMPFIQDGQIRARVIPVDLTQQG